MLPRSPRTSLGINERGPDRQAGTRRASGAGDLSRCRLAWARGHMKAEGGEEVASPWLRAGLHLGTILYQHIKTANSLMLTNLTINKHNFFLERSSYAYLNQIIDQKRVKSWNYASTYPSLPFSVNLINYHH